MDICLFDLRRCFVEDSLTLLGFLSLDLSKRRVQPHTFPIQIPSTQARSHLPCLEMARGLPNRRFRCLGADSYFIFLDKEHSLILFADIFSNRGCSAGSLHRIPSTAVNAHCQIVLLHSRHYVSHKKKQHVIVM
jgi:hypothetical protein